ncbi:hypothetical protein B0H13DRAFT_2338205 [Mycena leptocephala]|nr:hypothetical protein B0H13DRAFT_2338205 [Mycena leptocephala]
MSSLPSPPPLLPAVLTSRNVAQMLQYLGESKRLHADQITDGINSVNDPQAIQGAKMILCLHALQNCLDAFNAGKPPFTVSDDTETNIYFYAAAVLLSTKLSAYKGSVAKNILLDILKINCFDLLPNIECNPADYTKLVTVIKKGLAASFKVNKEPAPSAREHQNIFQLTTHLVHSTNCAVTPELCACVALMCQVYIEGSGPRFWDSLNADLRKICNRTSRNARKLNKAFKNVLLTDRATHGVKTTREVDDTISAAPANKAATIPAAAVNADEE